MTSPASTNESPLHAAWSALNLLDTRVQRNFFNDIEGIDTVDIGLDDLALALAELFMLPDTEGTTLDDVLAYLVSQGKLADEVLASATIVMEGVQEATYQGLTEEAIERTESARQALYAHIEELLSEVEKAQTDEGGQGDG